jgi:hypothetical protein
MRQLDGLAKKIQQLEAQIQSLTAAKSGELS